jgi:SAM-dependent methyltransferase
LTNYNADFYSDRHDRTIYAAEKILSILLETLTSISSVIDIGCGVGTWCYVLKQKGIQRVLGVDGPWVPAEYRVLSEAEFLQNDLSVFNSTAMLKDVGRFDCAISLEVAEHLPYDYADNFVDFLTSLADFCLFSAAIPHQGGKNHINEQWQSYWAKKFLERRFVAFDIFRPIIWNDEKIDRWYRQNIFLYVEQRRLSELTIMNNSIIYDIVHPDYFLTYVNAYNKKKSFHNSLITLLSKIMKKAS